MDALVYGALVTSLPDNAMIPKRAFASGTTGATGTFRTDLSVSGTGFLHAVFVFNNVGTENMTLRITIDGAAPTTFNRLNTATLSAIDGYFFARGFLFGLRFTSSLLVEVMGASGTSSVASNTIYSLDA